MAADVELFPKQLDVIYGAAGVLAKAVARRRRTTSSRSRPFRLAKSFPACRRSMRWNPARSNARRTPLYFYAGKDPTLAFATGTPFGMNTRQQEAWWHFGGGKEIINETLAKFKAISFPAGNSGTQMGGFFRKEIQSVDDLKGLKFRIGGFGGRVLAKLGVVPQGIAPGDLYPALERGTIRCGGFVGPADDEKLGCTASRNIIIIPASGKAGAMMHLAVGLRPMKSCRQTTRRFFSMHAKLPTRHDGRLRREEPACPAPHDCERCGVARLPPAGDGSVAEAANELYAEIAASNEGFKKALESYNSFPGRRAVVVAGGRLTPLTPLWSAPRAGADRLSTAGRLLMT